MAKLFGRRKQNKQIKKSGEDFLNLWETDLADIWSIPEKDRFLIAMNGWLCRKCNYGEETDKLTDAEKVIFVNNQLEAEVNNGGFVQFLYNGSGDFAGEIVNSLLAIGANQTAEIYKKALCALGELPKNQSEREQVLEQILTDDISELLDKCDDEFFKQPDDLEELNYQFIMKNKEKFN